MEKKLILVNSMMNLMLAIQLKNTLFKDDVFDIVLSDESGGLEDIYYNGVLKEVFSEVFFAKTRLLHNKYRKNRYMGIIDPAIPLKKCMQINTVFLYTDIFFWNPDDIFYFYYMLHQKNRVDFNLHVYSDGLSGYIMEVPDIDQGGETVLFPQRIINNILKHRYKYKYIKNLEYDFYMFAPEYSAIERSRNVVEIPPIELNSDNINYFNRVFNYDESFDIKEKFIFIERPIDEIKNVEQYQQILKEVVSIVGKDNFIIKIHPRSSADFYKEMGLNVIDSVFPWEVYCMNNQYKQHICITSVSTSVVYPNMLFGCNVKAFLIYKIIGMDIITQLEQFVTKYMMLNPNLKVFEKLSDLKQELILLTKRNEEKIWAE